MGKPLLGYGKRRLITEIIKKTWEVENPEDVKLSYNDVLYILQEMEDEEGKKYLEEDYSMRRGHHVFKEFTKQLLYRNLANYDSMVLITSEKGCITDDTKIMMPRDLIKYPEGVPIKDLIGKGPQYVYSFNIKTKKLELKKCDGVEFVKNDDVWEVELTNGKKIQATKDHPFLQINGEYTQLQDLIWNKGKEKHRRCRHKNGKNFITYTSRLRMIAQPHFLEDALLKTDYNKGRQKIKEHIFICSELKYDINKDCLIHHKNGNHYDNNIENLEIMSRMEHSRLHKYIDNNTLINKKNTNIENFWKINGNHLKYGGVIKSIKYIGKKDVYDVVNVQDNHNFIGNGFVISNTGKSSSSIMLARFWCQLIGIRFDPNRHMAYSNQDVVNKIDMLNKFEPLVCLTGDTLVKIKYKEKEYEERIDNLIHMKDYEVLTYNIDKNIYEYKKPEKTILQPENKAAYTIELENSYKIKATENHLVLTKKGYKKIKYLTDNDEVKVFEKTYKKIKKIIKPNNKTKVYDIINIPDNHNFIANNIVVHNCDEAIKFASSEDWNRRESKELKKRLGVIRTRHLLFILCFPLKISKVDKTYLECLDGNSKIQTKDGKIKIKDLEGKKDFEVLSYNKKENKYEYQKAQECVKTKVDYIYELTTKTGKKIRCTKGHYLYTDNGWKMLKQLTVKDKVFNINKEFEEIISIIKKDKVEVYDILNVEKNANYISDNILVHNSYVNYWVDLFGRGVGAVYVKDRNPVNDSWRMKDFKNVGSYTEFTSLQEVEKKLKKHPNFWQIIRFPKPPKWLYDKYLKVREKNVYDEESIREMVTTEDVHRSLLLLALQDIMMNDTTLNMNRIALHIKNNYDIPITKNNIQNIIVDAKQMVTKIREEQIK